jgi:hypothetical protein
MLSLSPQESRYYGLWAGVSGVDGVFVVKQLSKEEPKVLERGAAAPV